MNRRVVITGIGNITPLGNTVSEFWENIKNSKNGIDFITKFDTSDCENKIAAEVKNFQPTDYMEKKLTKRYDLFTQYGVASAVQAFNDSEIKSDEINADRFGIIYGSGIGGLNTMEEQIIKMHEKGPSRIAPLFIPMSIVNMAAGNIAIHLGAKGICTCTVTACATATNCIGEAFRSIKHGYHDIIVSGGAEASIDKIGIGGFTSIMALSPSKDINRASIPFDKERNGFVMGEGAGALVLEELEHAQKRGAKIYAEIVGYGTTCDAYHMTAPSPDGSGASKAMQMAINEAGISNNEISYINAHGTSTMPNDSAETNAIKSVFKEYAYELLISSTKSMTGHLLGAAGAVEAIIAIKSLQDNFVPPTINYKEKDPVCDLNYVPNTGVSHENKYVLSNSFGFGGHNAVLCFKKWE